MRISISTSLLLIGMIAVCVGWAVDRNKLKSELLRLNESNAERDILLFGGFKVYAELNRTDDLLFELDELGHLAELMENPDCRDLVQTQLVNDLLDVFNNQKQLEICAQTRILGRFDKRVLARNILRRLDCESADEFFEIATSLDSFSTPTHYPELHALESEDYQALRKLVNDAILIIDQIFPGPSMGAIGLPRKLDA